MKTAIVGFAIALSTGLFGCAAVAGPEANHPNLIAAREDVHHAMEHIKAAQVANKEDMGGHAANALNLLQQAEEEIKRAAEAANRH
jgi:hypothetical protein